MDADGADAQGSFALPTRVPSDSALPEPTTQVVSKMGEALFWQPLRDSFAKYVFGPLRDPSLLVPSLLGDDVVLYGAAAIAMPANA